MSTLKRLRRRYELPGLPGLIDQRHAHALRSGPPGGRTDLRVLKATRMAIAEQAGRCTG